MGAECEKFAFDRDPMTIAKTIQSVQPLFVDLANGEKDDLRKVAYAVITILLVDAANAIIDQDAAIREMEDELKKPPP